MKKISTSQLRHSHHTLMHYFLSYFLLLSFLLISFFLIVHVQLSKTYLAMLNQRAEQQLNHVKDQFAGGLSSIDQTNSSLASNINLIMLHYTNDSWLQYLAVREIKSYATANDLVECIVYYDKLNDEIYTSGKHVLYEDGVFSIFNNGKSVAFCPDKYEDSITNQLIHIESSETSCLLYYPYSNPGSNYVIFYIINEINVQNMLKGIVSDEILSTALVGPDGRTAIGVNQNLLAPHLSPGKNLDKVRQLDSQTSLQTCSGLYSGFGMAALISNKALMDQIGKFFSRTYLVLCLIGATGMLIVLFAMRKTYLPLRRLAQKIVEDLDPEQGYLEQLDVAFSAAASENRNLQEKIEKYRLSMQKSILDSIIADGHSSRQETLDNVDSFFTMEPDNLLFALRMRNAARDQAGTDSPFPLPVQEIAGFFREALPGKDSCLVLEHDDDSAIFLLSYPGPEENKEESILTLLENYYEEEEYLSALSNGASSPMDIPSLYENALYASREWSHKPVVAFRAMAPGSPSRPSLTYPYDSLEQLAQALKKQDFPEAHSQIQELFALIDSSPAGKNTLPDFFVRCVLIDILTALINAMNQKNIKFREYRDIYFEALYFCRSYPYPEKKAEIQAHIKQLLTLFQSEAESQFINAAQIQQLVEECYTSTEFSISYLADIFHVSITYMSFLFKKEMGENFSDYVWALRLEKAKKLLLTTDMPIDDISLAVGYLNASSFRRKFKQTTGMTPSQMRG